VLPSILILAQVGDQLDRGDHELEILYFLERLQREAARAGGALHVLNGNHEARAAARRSPAGGARRAGRRVWPHAVSGSPVLPPSWPAWL
jgi:hypothetical protein